MFDESSRASYSDSSSNSSRALSLKRRRRDEPVAENLALHERSRAALRLSHDQAQDRRMSTSPRSVRSNPMTLNMANGSNEVDVALTAMQYLPIPVLVLNSLKTVVLANGSFGRLVAESKNAEQGDSQTVSESLLGQTLSQIGIDLVQDGVPFWVSWESFLDEIGEGNDDEDDATETPTEDSTPKPDTSTESTTSNYFPDRRKNTLITDVAVDVVLSSQSLVGNTTRQKPASAREVYANMIISAWTSETERYYTLTFTHQAKDSGNSSSNSGGSSGSGSGKSTTSGSSRAVTKPTPTRPGHSPGSVTSGSSISGRPSYHGTSSNPSLHQAPRISSPMFPPHGPPSSARAALSSAPSVLQKATRLRDAMLNIINVPAYGMWKDDTVGIANEPMLKLAQNPNAGEKLNQRDFLRYYHLFTEDFSRQLELEEYPIMRLCRDEKPFKNSIVGMPDPRTGAPRLFDVMGEPILDEVTGAFLGGIVVFKDVSEYLERIKVLDARNADQFGVVANSIPQMVWVTNPAGSHEWFSQRWYDYTGLTEEQSLGDGWENPFHPDDMPATVTRWTHSLATGDEYITEYRCRRRDGQWRWMLGRALPVRDEDGFIVRWFGTCTDIHESVEARETARRYRQQLQQVLDTAKVTLMSVDKSRRITVIDGNLENQMYGMSTKDFVGQDLNELFLHYAGAPLEEAQCAEIQAVLDGTSRDASTEFKSNLTSRWFRIRFLPLTKTTRNGGIEGESYVDGAVGVCIDTTELRARQAELKKQEEANAKLSANALAAKEASRMKSQFLANMSHEIRTPIAGVIGMSDLMLDTELQDEQREMTENIQRSANGLLTVINDILDFSKVESGRLDIEEVPFCLYTVLRDINKMLSFAATRKNLSFQRKIVSDINNDLRVLGDPGRLRQILQNLLTNSIKFTQEGSVTLAAEVKSQTSDTLIVEFIVEDTGIGIEEEVRKKLFQPFSQADSSTARRYGGTGLGLTISKNLVELMKGEIKLESRLGNGSRASFWIPFKKVEYADQSGPLIELENTDLFPSRLTGSISMSISGGSDGSAHGGHPGLLTPTSPSRAHTTDGSIRSLAPEPVQTTLSESERKTVNVLVVEDNHINMQIAVKTIKKLGFSVNSVWDGQQALDYLIQEPTADHPRPDIILMDVQMPVLDGYRATHMLRNDEPYSTQEHLKNIPIVAMTASAIQGDKERCQRAGMNDYLSKPVRGKILEQMLVKWAIKSKSRSHSQSSGANFPATFSMSPAPHPRAHTLHPHINKPTRPGPSTLVQAETADTSPASSLQTLGEATPKDTATTRLDASPDRDNDILMPDSTQTVMTLDTLHPSQISPGASSTSDRAGSGSNSDRADDDNAENSRSMNRLWNEEKAMTLRDDKLLDITAQDRSQRAQSHADVEMRNGSVSGQNAAAHHAALPQRPGMPTTGRPLSSIAISDRSALSGSHHTGSVAAMSKGGSVASGTSSSDNAQPRQKLTRANMNQLAHEIQADDDLRQSERDTDSSNRSQKSKSLSRSQVRGSALGSASVVGAGTGGSAEGEGEKGAVGVGEL